MVSGGRFILRHRQRAQAGGVPETRPQEGISKFRMSARVVLLPRVTGFRQIGENRTRGSLVNEVDFSNPRATPGPKHRRSTMEIRSVLMVDDEPDIRLLGAMSLERVGGWNATMAASGSEAIQLAVERKPNLILLDMMMPGMDGIQTLERIRAEPSLQDVPVIFLTAKVGTFHALDFLALGVAGVLHKPFDPMTLPAQIREITDRWKPT